MGRDHSCEKCGRGGFNDPDGECICRERTCLTCGTRVEVVSTDEGTHHYRPAEGDLEWAFRLMRDCLQTGKKPEDYEQDRLDEIADALTRPTPTEQEDDR